MSQSPPPRKPGADPWSALGYIIAGVALYGVLGWLADLWLGTTFLVGIGIVVGAGLGTYLTIAHFRAQEKQDED